jgi:Butirosin biosynthesis protein H, N-terminal/Domain of unknown function (DUF4872)
VKSGADARVLLPLPHRRAGHCGSGAYRDLLEFHGLSWGEAPLSEGMAFGLGAGLGFAYVELPRMEPPVYLVGRTADLEKDICTHLGIGLDLRRTDDPDEGWAWLKAELDAGRPTMVWADIQHLEYLRVRLQMTMHDIVVCGYDEDEGVAFIADNDRDEIQRSTLDGLARARHSAAFPAPNRHATWVMDFPDGLPEPRPVIETVVRQSVENMTAGRGALDLGAEGMGLDGVARFHESYPRWPELFGDKLGAALRGLRVFIVKAGTGGALFRSLHAEFLHDAAALLGEPGLADAGRVYDELAATYVALAAIEEHGAGVPLVGRAVALERDGVDAMRSALS